MSICYRQGDILLIKQDQLPQHSRVVKHEPDRIVLAYGETTGHAHAISTQFAEAHALNGAIFLETEEGAVLVHEEHLPIPLAPGVYRVVRQREYSPAEGERYVRD